MKVNEHKVHLCKIYYYLVVRDIEKNTFSLGKNITSVLIKTFSKYFSYVLCIVNCYII